MFTPSSSPPGNHERQRCAGASHQCTAVTLSVRSRRASATGVAPSSVQRTKDAPTTSRRSSSGFGSGSGSGSSNTMVTAAAMPAPAVRPVNSPRADSPPARSVTLSEQTSAGETTVE